MKLKDMEIHEVSFVDAPANKRRFLLIKRQDGASVTLSIETDGTRDGTRVQLNGEALPDLMDFHFSYSKGKDGSPVSCSYSINDGSGRVETYYLSKPDMEANKMESIELLKSLTGLEIPEDAIEDEVFAKAVSTLGKYEDLMPDDLQDAVKYLAKQAVKTVVKSAEDNTASPDEMVQTSSTTSPAEPISGDAELILKAIAGINTMAKRDAPSQQTDPLLELKDVLESISTRLEIVEKTTAGEKSRDDDDGDDPQPMRKNDERWPSLSPWLGVS